MPRSMLAFRVKAADPIPAPGDYSIGKFRLTPLGLFPNEAAARRIHATVHEYIGLANYYWRVHYSREA